MISERKAAMRRTTPSTRCSVVALDAVAIGIYYLLDMAHRPQKTQTIFVVVWTAATAITVAFLLRRVRMARRL